MCHIYRCLMSGDFICVHELMIHLGHFVVVRDSKRFQIYLLMTFF